MPEAPRSEPALRTLIVDDEPLAVERLQILAAGCAELQLVGAANDAAAALRLIAALSPDLLLLDIAMPGMTGIELARALQALPAPSPSIVFVTAFEAFAVAAFDVDAADYLLKPADPERLARAVARVRERRAAPVAADRYAREFWVPHRAEIIRLDASAIDLIEAERDYMRLHVGARSYLLHTTIAALERRLDPAAFIRLHRSTIVRRAAIVQLRHDGAGNWHAELAGGRSCRVGRTHLTAVRAMAGR